ncbi:hypothetical protein B566_EDAN008338 [Ephemera danica]|nr:hypothetical protein B566_EDAN008338 [Ephemera danica]
MVAVSRGHAFRSLLKLVILALAIMVLIQVLDRVKREQPAEGKDVNAESAMAALDSFNSDLHEMLRTVEQLTSVVSSADVARRHIHSYLDLLQDCCVQLWDDIETLAINNVEYLAQFSRDLDDTIKNNACVSLMDPVRRRGQSHANNNFALKMALLPLTQLQGAWRDVKDTALNYHKSKPVAFKALQAVVSTS